MRHSECLSSTLICYRAALYLTRSKAVAGHLAPFRTMLIPRICSFFSEVRRITASDYIPSNEDILRAPVRAPVRTVAKITETYVNMGQLTLHFWHASSLRGERKKWIHFLEGVTCIVFCASLSDYEVGINGLVCACLRFALTDVHDCEFAEPAKRISRPF